MPEQSTDDDDDDGDDDDLNDDDDDGPAINRDHTSELVLIEERNGD